MPIVADMSYIAPSHILRVGLDPAKESPLGRSPNPPEDPSEDCGDLDLDISLENLNQLILELDPTFEPIPLSRRLPPRGLHTGESSPDEDVSGCVLVSRGCPPATAPAFPCVTVSPPRGVPVPAHPGASCSPHGSLVFSDSSSSWFSRPPLPCGSVRRRRSPSQQAELSCSPGALRTSPPGRNSAASLLSTSPGSETSYILGSCLSLASEDGDSPEAPLFHASGSLGDVSLPAGPFGARHGPDKPSPTGPSPVDRCPGVRGHGAHSSPASLAGSLTDIPVLLVNGAPQPELRLGSPPEIPLTLTGQRPSSPQSFQMQFHGSQQSMKFVMDTSKFWFRPHIDRAEAEAMLRDQAPGSFVVRDSTSFRGSFGLAMKVDPEPAQNSPTSQPGESNSELIRHFLIESSAKGVRIKGSHREPYFGSLSALVYQHTVSACALPCKLLLQSHDLDQAEEDTKRAEVMTKTACNYLYLSAIPTEMLTGPCAVQRAVTSTIGRHTAITPTVVNLKVSSNGVTLTDIQRKHFFRRHYPAHLLSYSGEDPDKRLWLQGSKTARMFGIVAKSLEAGVENVCHVFAEYDALQPCSHANDLIRDIIARP